MGTSSDPPHVRRLSVAVIARDEQDVLADTIGSVRSIADEIVVLDTGSTDRTPAIAEKLGAKVLRMPWGDDFSAARNRCLDEATGDWVLWLDAGEQLDAESAETLRDFVNRQADPNKAYMLMVEISRVSPNASSEQAARPRLMPRLPEIRFEGRVRETLRPSIQAAGLEVDTAPGRILCHVRRHDPQRKAQRARRNLKIVALEGPAGDRPQLRLLLAAGEAMSDLGDQEGARRSFLQAIQVSQSGSTGMLEAYYGLLTTYEGDPAQNADQLAACVKALEVFPLDAQLLCALGNYLQVQNRIELAARAFDTAVKYGQIDLETWHLTEIAEIASVCLALILQLQKKEDESRRVLEEAVGRHGQSVRLRRHLMGLHVKHARLDEALGVADGLPLAAEEREPLRNAIRGACKAVQKDWGAALGYLQSAYVAGCQDPLCLRWLVVTLLSNGRTEAVVPVLRKWQEAEPNNAEAQRYLEILTQPSQPATATEQRAARPVAEEADRGRQLRIDHGTTTPGLPVQPPQTVPCPPAQPSADPSTR